MNVQEKIESQRKGPDARRAMTEWQSDLRRRKFVQAFLRTNNVVESVRIAGFDCSTVASTKTMAYKLLRRPDVRKALELAREEAAAIAGLSAVRTLREVARIAYFDPAKIYNEDGSMMAINEMAIDQRAAIASYQVEETYVGDDEKPVRVVTRKIKFHRKGTALDQAMKHLGLYEKDNEQLRAQVFAVLVPEKARVEDAKVIDNTGVNVIEANTFRRID